jgi:NADH:ubiquinone oxidoreductase subunit E
MKKIDHLSIELLWDSLLSREPEKIKSTFHHLNQSERSAVIEHLNRMTTEDGWHPEQKNSALIVLQIIEKLTKGNKQK